MTLQRIAGGAVALAVLIGSQLVPAAAQEGPGLSAPAPSAQPTLSAPPASATPQPAVPDPAGSQPAEPTLAATARADAEPLAESAPTPPSADPEEEVLPETDRLIVRFAEGVTEEQKAEVLDEASTETEVTDPEIVKESVGQSSVVEANTGLDEAEQREAVEKLSENPLVESAEPDLIVSATSAVPNASGEPYWNSQWNMRTIDAPGAWQSATGSGVTIGVVDTGIVSHPDLNQKVVPGYDFVSDNFYGRDGGGRDANPRDEGTYYNGTPSNWHGTHVAGIAGAVTGNRIGVAGVAPDARIQPVRALGTAGSGYVSDIADATAWAAGWQGAGMPRNANPSQVVNVSMSWGGSCPAIMQSAINEAHARNVPVVVASGNAGIDASGAAPANCWLPIVVGATASNNTLTGYSNYGRALDVVAPGGTVGADIWSTVDSGTTVPVGPKYGPLNGTSMAAPHVAGTIALMKQANRGLTVEQIRNALTSTGRSVGGYPLINANRAVNAVKPKQAAPAVGGAIGTYYRSNGGAGTFGQPTGGELSLIHGGAVQEFDRQGTRAAIYWHPSTGARAVHWWGAIGAKFRQGGYERTYGFPGSEEVRTGTGSYQFFNHPGTRATNLIMWSPSTGVGAIRENSGIGGKWASSGRENAMGYPVGDEVRKADGAAYQFFRIGGRSHLVMWTPQYGARTIVQHGAIGQAWINAGREGGWGYPVTDEYRGSDGRVHQKFSRGVEVVWWPNGMQVRR
ncbi:S8 family serine peptidase [Rothia sp. AR01]|uniref:S8 family serine peptidase n=1 Tax=Rothia santali TaxID=2949643 RepID=A0A9X2HFZ5_9MICC|nr:S8 family serine peptidase [Rothia santali]MCP3426649.1 S8 family serine peptidase [Rothia santali]